MPPICLHLSIASEAASQLDHSVVKQRLGSYFLGSTAPDIRLIIGASREETHFIPLESEEGVSGVKPLFESYPELARTDDLNVATRSFVAGYLSHLVTDETWIYQIYRPFFGKSSPFGGDPLSNLLDRALQFELDSREQADKEAMRAIGTELFHSNFGVALSLIDAVSLEWWRDFVIAGTLREPTRDRFRVFAERYLAFGQKVEPAQIEPFLASFDSRLKQVLEIVPQERLQAFRECAIASSVAAAREYLG